MKNPLTFHVESSLGAVFISLLAMFFIGLMLVAVKNFESDLDIMSTTNTNTSIKTASPTELAMVREWVATNNIELKEGQGYRYLLRKYPSRPWLDF